MLPVDVEKKALRAQMREIRRAIAADPADRLARSARIWSGVVAAVGLEGGGVPAGAGAGAAVVGASAAVPGGSALRRVMLFESLPTEPDTSGWYAWCAAHDVLAYAPLVSGADLLVVPGDLDPSVLDVVVVPGLAFTTSGLRLGQGGGHYDRFLARLRPDCITVGVGFAEQLVDAIPTEPHDVRLDLVVTDSPATATATASAPRR